jgi:hypothetical protein
MVKINIPKRFAKNNLNEETLNRITNLIGPIQNFYGAGSIQYLNLRIQIDQFGKKFRVVNDYNHKYEYKISEYIKNFLRVYSDGIFTNESYISKNYENNFEPDFNDLNLSVSSFQDISSRLDGLKSIGIISKDINLGYLQKHAIFKNDNYYKYLIASENKTSKLEKTLVSKNLKLNE